MSRNKKEKFEELKTFQNVFEWNNPNFGKDVITLVKKYNHIILELGCGQGEYTLYLAQKYSKSLVVGIDIQGERIWKGAKTSLEKKVTNAYFIRMQIDNITSLFPKSSINGIWLTFPDPFPKERDSKRRLTSPKFLSMYSFLLKRNGLLHLKTDSKELYEFSKESATVSDYEVTEEIEDVYAIEQSPEEVVGIQTTFEKKYINQRKSIRYLQIKKLDKSKNSV